MSTSPPFKRLAQPRPIDWCSHLSSQNNTQYAFLFVVFLLVRIHRGEVGASRDLPAHYARFFQALGQRIRTCRTERKLSQEDMISYGFSVRHWQMIEAGRPFTMVTLLRVCETFEVPIEQLVSGLRQYLPKIKGR